MHTCFSHAGDLSEGLEDTVVNRSEGLDNISANRTEEEEEEEGFVLEPVERTGLEKRVKRKRRLVVDTDKEFTGQQIKSQFDDYKDLLQPKCFPPPTKKAMMWKEMAGCDQLYSHPTFPSLGLELRDIITLNYGVDIPGEPAPENVIELDNITDGGKDADITAVEAAAEVNVTPAGDVTPADVTNQDSSSKAEPSALEGIDPVDMIDDGGLQFGYDNGMDGIGGELLGEEDLPGSKSPDMIDFDAQGTEEQQSNELSEEFEQRRWTKRTQQVLGALRKKLSAAEDVYFSALTIRCNRKQAASKFYTCLLLAKEGMITATQPEPYADIRLEKGPKFMD